MSTPDPERVRAHAANMLRDWLYHDHAVRPTRKQLREWVAPLLDERAWLYVQLSKALCRVRDLEGAPAHDEVRAALRIRLRQLVCERDALRRDLARSAAEVERLRAELATWEDEPVGRATCPHPYRGTMGSDR